MRAPLPLLAAALTLALAACGGDDDAADAADTADTADTAGTTTAASAEPTTTITIPIASEQCEEEPDAADYVEGQIPPAVRPCELPTELVVHTIRAGSGHAAADGDTLIADYTGFRSVDGFVFDSSYTRAVPLDFPLGRGGVIPGWDQGLLGSQAGSLLRLDIPADLAYGDTPPPGTEDRIRPGDDLSFIVEVRAVIPTVTPDDAPLDLEVEPSVDAAATTVADVEVGDGAPIELGSTAVIHLLLVRGDNEVVLFNSWERNDPLQILMEEGQTLPGLFQGLQGASVGTKRVITMPPTDAFGPDGEPGLGLPADTDLIAVVEVVGAY